MYQLANFFDLSSDLYCVLEKDGKILFLSPSWSNELDQEISTLIGKNIRDLIAPWSLERAEQDFQEVLKTGHLSLFENIFSGPNGAPITLCWNARRGDDGYLYGSARNIAPVLEAEATRKILEQMALLGEVTSTLAHDVRTPLSMITMVTEKLQNKHPEENPVNAMIRADLERINKATSRIESILKVGQVFARGATHDQITNAPLALILRDLEDLTKEKLSRSQSSLEIHMDFSDTKIECNETKILQVLTNLVNNASDAIEKLEERWIKVSSYDQGENVRLEVVDSGHGISPDFAESIFKLFYTTKAKGKGTGLGLNISRRMVEEHQGTLLIDHSKKNTCFAITLPKKQHPEANIKIDLAS